MHNLTFLYILVRAFGFGPQGTWNLLTSFILTSKKVAYNLLRQTEIVASISLHVLIYVPRRRGRNGFWWIDHVLWIFRVLSTIFQGTGLESYDILSSVPVLHSLKSEMARGQTEASNCPDALSFHSRRRPRWSEGGTVELIVKLQLQTSILQFFLPHFEKGFSLVWDPSQVVNLVISTLVSNLTLCDSEMDTMHDSFNVQQVQGNEIHSIPSPVRVQWREYQEVRGINKVYPPWNQHSHSPWK